MAAYLLAWTFDFLIPLTLGTLIAIISSKEARDFLFPPAPLALVSMSTGGLQKPQAGQLGTKDTLSGAPEMQEGEAKEEEAAKIVHNIRHIIQKTVGMHENEQNEGDPLEGKIPKPIRKGIANVKAAGTSSGHATGDEGMTEGPMEDMIWEKANPEKLAPLLDLAPHAIGEIVDNWERFENVLAPTAPFNKFSFLRLDVVFVPLFLASFFISSYMVYKGTGAAIGFAIFGDPIMTPSLQWLDRNYPNWMQLLEPKNNILRGVPSHAQLTLILLRIGEVNHTPIPPVPSSKKDDAHPNTVVDPDEVPLGATTGEKLDAMNPSPMQKAHSHESGNPSKDDESPRHKHLSKITRVFKGQTKAAVSTKLAADKVLAAAGNETAKGHLGVLPKEERLVYAGPTDFKARYQGKKGWVHITEGEQPLVVFTKQEQEPLRGLIEKEVEFSIPVADIHILKRAAAFANKVGEKAAEFSQDRELLSALEIQDAKEKTYRFTALPERDELFNRLVAMGNQRWVNL